MGVARKIWDGAVWLFGIPPKEPEPRTDGFQCSCHARMGNDFWFLPSNDCLRDDKKCDWVQ